MQSFLARAARRRRAPLAASYIASVAIACSSEPDSTAPSPSDSSRDVPSDAASVGGAPAAAEVPADATPPGTEAPRTAGGATQERSPHAGRRIHPDLAAAGGAFGAPPAHGEAGAPSTQAGSAGSSTSGTDSGGTSAVAGAGGKSAAGGIGLGGTSGGLGGTSGGLGGTSGGLGGTSGGLGGASSAGSASSSSGAGGVIGTPSVAGETCSLCGSDACAAQFARCEGSPVCSDWLACTSGCADAECARACDETYRDAVLLTVAVYGCLCRRCSGECGGLSVCGRRCEEGAAPPDPTATAEATLEGTGLYSSNGRIAPYVRRYRPEYELFSDFAVKERFVYLPRCAPIDTRDMDHWSFPVGTRLWKEFSRDGVRIETRMLARYGTRESDWVMTSYGWPLPGNGSALDPGLATPAPDDGATNVNGTEADIPSQASCRFCHERLTDRVLGFGAIQLSHRMGGVTFANLADWGALSDVPVRTGYDPPGDARAKAALGYLHANCGGCHNDTGVGVSMYLRLKVGQTTVESTWAYTTAVDVPTTNSNFRMDRIEPGNPNESAVIARMLRDPSAGERLPMPPLGRELVHTDGVAAVSAWVQSLPR